MIYFRNIFNHNSFIQKNHLFIHLYIQQVYKSTMLSAEDTVVNNTEMVSAFMGDWMLNV